ncbi:cysteine-rich receptor-like protein kinase 2 [Rutidosis leptorrhynchoides]|uniref:cysteine-rich receptor-like protein kinase 2 n=1 Tax=Rutidosis leptorrhynchoides TaxID=125765 RepID=UPI003A99FCF1
MNMKAPEKRLLTWRLTSLSVTILVLVTMSKPVTSQISGPTDRNSTLMRYYCSMYKGTHENYFLINLNDTLSSLRHQLTSSGYAADRVLINGESVWGLAWCRGYLSTPDCLSCFDYAVNQLKVCGNVNGAHAIYSDCDVRYENYNFYAEANDRAGVLLCDNTTSPQPTEFQKAAEKLLSDLRIAAPRAPKYYAVSTRQVADGSATVYAIAQCNLNISQSVCSQCLQLRSASLYQCLPTITGRAMDNGCFMRYSRTPFFGLNQTTDISSLLWDGDSNKKRSIIGGVVGGVSLLLLVLAFFLWYRRSKKMSRDHQDKSATSIELLQGPSTYSYNDLKEATNNFSDENRLGGGMFGEVYKGTLKGGDAVAIKKTFMASGRGKRRFNDELKIISNVHHRHIVRLLGYCSKGPHLFLVHEYMENRSLDQFLFGDKTMTLNWKQRFDIIYGIARGLAYLHEQYHVTIIHRDIKTSNILLDNEFQPKISDFGLIRLLPEDKTHLSTKLAGSKNSGYVAPEYAIHGQLSEKVDTYSFGIVVLEIISGKMYNDVIDDKSTTQNLLDHAWNLYDNGTHNDLIDEKLDPSGYVVEDVLKIIEIALMCTQSPVSARPSMSEVVTLLSDKSVDDKPQPVRSFISDDEVRIQISNVESSTSVATDTTNTLSGR